MYKKILQGIENIEIWPIVSFLIFFIFFLCLLLWVFTADKKFIEEMKMLPFDSSSPEKETSNSKP